MALNKLALLEREEENHSAGTVALRGELDPIHANLEELRAKTRKLEDLQYEFLSDNDKRTQKKIERMIDSINKQALSTKELIMQFGRRTEELEAKGGRGAERGAMEMRRNQFQACGRNLVEVTKGAWTMQQEHEAKRTNQVSKRLQARFTDDDGRQLMAPEEAQAIAKRLVVSGNEDQLFSLARDELEKAMDRKEAVLEIERSMRELYQMFCDLNVLVMDQGEVMDVMEKNVENANSAIRKGQKDLHTADRKSVV